MELKDKTIIITGASSGIGAAAALLFAQSGANVVLGARRKDRLDQITKASTTSALCSTRSCFYTFLYTTS